MNKPINQQLMERILNRLQTDSHGLITASSTQLNHATNQLIDDVRQLNKIFSAAGQSPEGDTYKPQSSTAKR